jgi:signal transduction histidine kinase
MHAGDTPNWRQQPPRKGLTLTAALADHEVRVLGEGTELRRLFLILVDNAIKYTEPGSIHLTLSAEGEHLNVTVSDTGIGIEKVALPRVFDRFWRADKARSRPEGGASLRLSLASQVVQKHGGSISVESEIGRGSTFTVQLSDCFKVQPS